MVYPDLTGRYDFFGGEIPMKTLKFEGDQLAFTVEIGFGDQVSEMGFKGKVDGKSLKGQTHFLLGHQRSHGQEGGGRVRSPKASSIVGTWEFTREGQDGTRRDEHLDDQAGHDRHVQGRDTEFPVTGLTVNGDQVSFKVTMKYNDTEVPMEFKGKVEGGTLKGEFISDRGTREAVGKKVQ